MTNTIDFPRQRYGVGQAVRRIEDKRLLTGHGAFTDDTPHNGDLHVVFLRSPHPHARLVAIDTVDAGAMPGVADIITGADLARDGVGPMPALPDLFNDSDGNPPIGGRRPLLATKVARFVGEALVAVVAESMAQALDALERVAVEYETLPAVTSLHDAQHPDAAKVAPDAARNVSASRLIGDSAAVEAAFARASHVVDVTAVNQRVAPVSLEPRAIIAWPDEKSGRLFVRMSNQMPSGVRNNLAMLLGLGPDDVRVQVGDVGGGFGMKTGMYPEDAVVAYAALKLRRPCRWIPSRQDDFLSAVHGRDMIAKASLALDDQGRFLAMRVRTEANIGAYPAAIGLAQPFSLIPGISTSVYQIPAIEMDQHAVLTHTAPIGAYRGAGSPEAIFVTERLIDQAAIETGIDAIELRRRNLIQATQMPFTNPVGQTYDCGDFAAILDAALKTADWTGFDGRAAQSATRGRLRGRALVTFLKACGANAFTEDVEVRIDADGHIEVVSATMPMGQGIATSYAQLLVETFDVPIERIRVIQGDTDRANGFGSGGSRSLLVGGSVISAVAKQTLDAAREFAADTLEVSPADLEYAQGEFTIAGTDRKIDLFALAGKQADAEIKVVDSQSVDGQTWPNAAQICEVEIDPDTGTTQVVRFVGVYDVGTVVSPQIVAGQLEGGIVQAIGQVLSEEVVYDPDTGQMLTASLMDYALPQFGVIDGFTTVLDQSIPTARNALGAKGVGEIGTTGATPVVMNAVLDALRRAGVGAHALKRLQMPLTAARVWAALHER